MFKLVKWAYELGIKNERRRIREGLLLKVGGRPAIEDLPNWKYKDERSRKDAHNRELEIWYKAQDIVSDYFNPPDLPHVPEWQKPNVEDK